VRAAGRILRAARPQRRRQDHDAAHAAGLLPPDSGAISIFGIDARADPIAAKRIVAWLPDEPMLYDKLDPLEYLEFVAGLWGVPPRVSEPRAAELLALLGLGEHARQRCEGFSRGMKQKVALAGALIHEPRTGLDAAAARQVKDILRERTRAGCAVVLTTHILEVAERLADRIGIIQHGRLVAEGPLEELRAQAGRARASLEDVFLHLTGAGAPGEAA
jgi:ABC-2 type transport system ATP-binding protein